METLRYIAYFLCFPLYWTFSYFLISLAISAQHGYMVDLINGTNKVNVLGIFILVLAVSLPFLVVSLLINKLYPGLNKRRRALLAIRNTFGLIVLYAVLAAMSKTGTNLFDIAVYVFTLSLMIALFVESTRHKNAVNN